MMQLPKKYYLKFRHFVRHAYGFQLKWEDMKPLLFGMSVIWTKLKEEINIFLKNN